MSEKIFWRIISLNFVFKTTLMSKTELMEFIETLSVLNNNILATKSKCCFENYLGNNQIQLISKTPFPSTPLLQMERKSICHSIFHLPRIIFIYQISFGSSERGEWRRLSCWRQFFSLCDELRKAKNSGRLFLAVKVACISCHGSFFLGKARAIYHNCIIFFRRLQIYVDLHIFDTR